MLIMALFSVCRDNWSDSRLTGELLCYSWSLSPLSAQIFVMQIIFRTGARYVLQVQSVTLFTSTHHLG